MSVIYAGDFNEVYPDSLQRLHEFGVKPSVLTCPAVKRESNASLDIDLWSGYRLITSIRTKSPPTMVFVYCHPENHRGQCGNVAFVDAHVEILRSEEFERLLSEQGIIHHSMKP